MRIRITECSDVDLLDAIITDDSVYSFICDDTNPPASQFTCKALVEDPRIKFYLVTGDYEPVGAFAFIENELHTMLLKSCRGRFAITAGLAMIQKFFDEHPNYSEIRSFAFKEQKNTGWYAHMLGMREVGEPFEYQNKRGGKTVTRINFVKER